MVQSPKGFLKAKLLEYKRVLFFVGAPKELILMVFFTTPGRSRRRAWKSGCSSITLVPGCSRTQKHPLAAMININTRALAHSKFPTWTATLSRRPRGLTLLLHVDPRDLGVAGKLRLKRVSNQGGTLSKPEPPENVG